MSSWKLILEFEDAQECLTALHTLRDGTQLGFWWKVEAEGIQEGSK